MKKWIVRGIIGFVVLIILAIVAVGLFLDGAIKRGVETVGPRLTKVDVKLRAASLSLLSGSGKIKGLMVGNPEGFKTPSAINIGQASLAVQPSSVFSDKVVIRSINVEAPEITFETDLRGNNLSKILANLESATGGSSEKTEPKASKPSKKLQVDDFLISGAKVHVSLTALGGKSATVSLPDIHLQNLGQGPEGITQEELAKRVLKEVLDKSIQASASTVTDLAKGAVDLGKDLGKSAGGAVEKIGTGLGNLLKKK